MSGVLLATSLAEAEEIGLEKGKKLGKELGREEAKRQIFLNFHKSGLAIDRTLPQIAEITGIDLEDVKTIFTEMKAP